MRFPFLRSTSSLIYSVCTFSLNFTSGGPLTSYQDLSSEESQSTSTDKPVYVEAHDPTQQLNKVQLEHTLKSLAAGLRHVFKIRDGDVVLGFCENSVSDLAHRAFPLANDCRSYTQR